jgi:ADP-heptose:LPS heptosyltransferase
MNQDLRPMMSAAAALPLNACAEREFIVLCAPVRRIVTVHSGSLRELLFALPALRALRETFEGARLVAVVREGLAPLLRSCSLVDEVVARPEGGLSSQAQLMAKLHAQHCDVVVAFSTSRNGVLLAWSSGASVRLGFDGAKMDALLTHRVARDTSTRDLGTRETNAPLTIEEYLDLARALGCAPRCHDYTQSIRPSVAKEREVTTWLERRDIKKEFIVLMPPPEGKSKRHARANGSDAVRWSQTALLLSRRAPVILCGAQPQSGILAAVRHAGGSESEIFDAAGAFDVVAQAALFGRARAFIGVSSAASHLAAAMSTPVVALRPDLKPELQETDTPRGVSHRLLPGDAMSEEIARAALELIGL